jgi:small redox-active disulfide protein 2
MTVIKVLGTGCPSCSATVKLIAEVAQARGADIQVEKLEDIKDIMRYGVMSTPGVVIDEKVVHAGGVPTRAKVESWIA